MNYTSLKRQNCYSPGRMVPSFLAPTVTQRMASHLTLLSEIGGGVIFCRKPRAFLSFQMVHQVSIVRDAMAFLLGVLLLDWFTHHSFIEFSRCQVDVSRFSRMSRSLTKFQRRRVKRHLQKDAVRILVPVLQRGHRWQFGHPRRANLSSFYWRL